MELSKNEEHQDKLMQAMMMAPATMLTFNGQVHFEFDDFEIRSVNLHEFGKLPIKGRMQMLMKVL